MKTVYFTAKLLADAVISERGATTGGHRCLDHIPGATILGAVAARLYTENNLDTFDIFHSGRVRFGNAYPLTGKGNPTLPMPLCWHAAKGEDVADVKNVKNLIHATKNHYEEWDKKGEQQKQQRSGFFCPQSEKIDPVKNYRLKTAINREKQGIADDAQLFGYQSLASGSHWYFSIACDDGVPQGVMDSICSVLTDSSIRVGRSRSAEYGLLAVAKADVNRSLEVLSPCSRLLIYCVSDLALTDPVSGAAALIPAGHHFGLGDAVLTAQHSYLRTRTYAPFNATRKHFDLERQVISKGSVLVFEKASGEFTGDELTALQCRVAKGIGLHRQDGLGQVMISPSFLRSFGFADFSAPKFSVQTASPAAPPAIAAWLTAKMAEQAAEQEVIKQVDDWINDLTGNECPKNSQWGQLRTIAVQGKSLDDIKARLSRLCTEGVSQKQWSKKVKGKTLQTTYERFLFETVLAGPLDLVRKRLYLLGNRLPRKNNQQNGGDQ